MAAAGIEGFKSLSNCVSLYQPPTLSILQDQADHAPSLIVLCSWMGAAMKYIAKYTQGYQTLYPSATIILIRCSPGTFLHSETTVRRNLAPACEIVRSHAALAPATSSSLLSFHDDTSAAAAAAQSRPRIVLHAMSNGGGTMAVQLISALRRTPNFTTVTSTASTKRSSSSASSSQSLSTASSSTVPRLPFSAFILDCFPSRPRLSQAVLAFTAGLPRALRLLGGLAIRVVLTLYMLYARLLRRTDPLTQLRRRLNDRAVFDVDTPRAYLYSKADRMVGWHDVADHVADARREGFCAREEVFATAPHCALLTEDRKRYWRIVQEVISGRGSSSAATEGGELEDPRGDVDVDPPAATSGPA